MPELKLGPGLRLIAIVLSLGCVAAVGFVSGTIYMKVEQGESTVEVLQEDSKVGVKIRKETQELEDELEEWLKTNDPYDKHGNPTYQWLQYVQRQRDIAKRRGDRRGTIRKITNL